MKLKSFFLVVLSIHFAIAQQPKKPTSGEIYQNLKALNFLGSVLYIAAHPDDENTRLISYLSNQVHANTAYLSLTRGDGGQNLIGPEIGAALGLIRTHELLEARKIDGGQQFFTRAIDFGYSKTPDETLSIWKKDKVLADVVWTIRNFKPDVIINRFDHRTPGSTHGHHTASALLSVEAFDKASEKNQFPEQLQYTKTWQPKRLFFNTSWWFYGSKENFEKANKSNLISVDIGQFNPLLGLSINEIAANSRTQHKSQGFGSTGTRGQQIEYLEFLKGTKPQKEAVFSGINTTWSRLENGQQIANILKPLEQSFDFNEPWRIVPQLLKARDLINQINDNHWRKLKLKHINLLIKQCLGLFLEAKTSTETAYPGQNISIDIELINRSPIQVQLKSIFIENENIGFRKELRLNKTFKHELKYQIPKTTEFTSPYWLKQPANKGLYQVNSQQIIGQPTSNEAIEIRYNLSINGEEISYKKPLVFKTNSPIDGEVYDYFKIIPQVNLSFSAPQLSFNQPETKIVNLTIKANKTIKDAVLEFNNCDSWTIYPSKIDIKTLNSGESQHIELKVKASNISESCDLKPVLKSKTENFQKHINTIDYKHIGQLHIVEDSKLRLNKFNIKVPSKKVAYINGAGSSIPENLSAIGINVDRFNINEITTKKLKNYDVVITGLRLYNIESNIDIKQALFENFVANGGHLIIQYNTNRSLKTNQFKPLNFNISRDRVTDETAKMEILEPQHPIINQPNKITTLDFENWVQERGLYFADKWSESFTPIFSLNDANETPKKGALIIGEFGKGHVTYSGISFFRQLPANVEGAYKLLTNLIAL